MFGFLKLMLFLLFVVAMGFIFYKVYEVLNEKITSSSTAAGLIGYALLLFIALGAIFFGGIYLFFRVYLFLMH